MKTHCSADSASDRALQRGRGAVRLRFEARGAATRLVERHACAPLRVLTPRPSAGAPEVVIANLAGGVAGGDRYHVQAEAGPGAEGLLSGQAAEKVYRAIDRPAVWRTRLRLGPGAALEWLPQETILFDGARLERWTGVDLAPDARFLAVETLVFGRAAHGERMSAGGLADRWRIDRGGRPVWRDALCIDGDFEAAFGAEAGLRDARVSATLLYAAPDAEALLAELRRLLAAMTAFAGATALRGLLLARFLAHEGGAFKRELAALLGAFRAMALGRPAAAPRVWLC